MAGRRRFLRTPVVPQMEEQDCAAACLTSVLGGLGLRVGLAEVNRRCGVTRDGASAGALVRAAGSYGVRAVGRRISDDPTAPTRGLDKVPVPAIVLVQGPHFAVFEGLRGRTVRINDPSLGRYRTTPAAFWHDFTGITVGFTPGPDFRPGGPRFAVARDLGRRVRPYRTALTMAVLIGLLVSAVGVLTSWALRHTLTLLGHGAADAWLLTVAAAVAVAVVVLCGSWLQQRLLARVLVVMSARSSTTFLWRMLRLPGAFFHRRSLGGLVTRVQLNDGMAVLLSGRIAAAATALTTAVVYLVALLVLAPTLAPVAVAAAVAYLVLLAVIAHRRQERQHAINTLAARRDAAAFAGVASIETIKAEGSEDAFFSSWVSWQSRVQNLSSATTARTLAPFAVAGVLSTAAAGAAIVIGMQLLLAGRLDQPTFLVFLVLLNGFMLPVGSLVGIGSELVIARGQAALLSDVEQADPDPLLAPVLDSAGAPPLSGQLAVADLEFGYDPNKPPLLHDISLNVRAGEWLAVVGTSGSGKSTLARLVAGALHPWSGQVLMDGTAREQQPRAALINAVAYVEQTPQLFAGTIRDNLTLWSDAVAEERLWAALVDAEAAELVRSRGGLDALIEEDARNLSGGERQRLEVARALAGDPAVLVLDEATSALDADTELRLNANLRRRGCTCLVFAHRLSTIAAADRIVVLDEGRVVQSGTYHQVQSGAGVFQTLVGELR